MRGISLRTILKWASEFRDSKWFAVFFVCVLLGGFIVLTSEVHEARSGEVELIGTIDQMSLDFLIKCRNKVMNGIAVDLTALGSGAVLTIVTLFLCMHFILAKRFILTIHLLSASLGAAGLTWLLKFYFERSRPDVSLRLVDVQGFSYPSGHSLSATAVYFTLAILVCKTVRETWARMILWTLFLGVISLIGITRIYLGVHFFSDVLAGILIGISWASLVEFIVSHFKKSHA